MKGEKKKKKLFGSFSLAWKLTEEPVLWAVTNLDMRSKRGRGEEEEGRRGFYSESITDETQREWVIINKNRRQEREELRNNKAWYEVFVQSVFLLFFFKKKGFFVGGSRRLEGHLVTAGIDWGLGEVGPS